jgi:hypothetical protein
LPVTSALSNGNESWKIRKTDKRSRISGEIRVVLGLRICKTLKKIKLWGKNKYHGKENL